jgi:hypothetical protein
MNVSLSRGLTESPEIKSFAFDEPRAVFLCLTCSYRAGYVITERGTSP